MPLRQLFDVQFQRYVTGDKQGSFRLCLDFAVDNAFMDATVGAVLYGQLFPRTTVEHDTDEEVLYSIAAALIGMHFAWTPELKGVITVSLVMIGMHIAWMPELRGVISVLSLVLDTPTALMVGLPSMT